MSSIGSILASQALKNIYLTKWTFGGPLNVREWSKLYFHLETCRLRIQEYSIGDNYVGCERSRNWLNHVGIGWSWLEWAEIAWNGLELAGMGWNKLAYDRVSD